MCLGKWPNCLTALVLTILATALLAACGPKTEQDYFEKADARFIKGRFQGAVQMYQRYLLEFPDGEKRDQALFRSGEILYYALGERAPAVRNFGALVLNYPGSPYAFRAREILAGVFRDETQDYIRAVLEYKWMLRQKPDHPRAQEFQFQVARCYLMAGDYEQAVLEFGAMAEKHPESPLMDRVYDELAGTYMILRQPGQALFIYKSLIKRFPKSPLVLPAEFKMGNALEDMHRYAEALKVYTGLLDRYDNRPAVEVRIAGVKSRQKNQLGKVKAVDYNYRPEEAGENLKNLKEDEKKKSKKKSKKK